MPTPSIQTLRADAQQVLNLDSISAVRSVVAATLANANAGTPLNPNLTTQQLWNEFYQIVTQPKSDIESIIANQLMKFLYAPPAPGGVGADKQVIFNDGGVLAGDPQFLWNKTTNLLTVTGAATITGDLTVRTTGLILNTSGLGVGISPTSFGAGYGTIQVSGATGSGIKMGSPTNGSFIYSDNTWLNILTETNVPHRYFVNNQVQYTVQHPGVFTWLDGAGGTRMTLNSTGLLIGTTNNFGSSRLCVQGTAGTGTPDVTIGTPVNSGGNTNLAIGRSAATNGFIFLDAYKAAVGGTELVLNHLNGGTVLIGLSTVVAAGGCLQLKSGITFPATQVASSDPNTLDDYEEGTWTIGLTFGGASTGITTSANTGRYTKVGRQVTVSGILALTNKGSSTGIAEITGLPFTIANANESYSAANVRFNFVSFADVPISIGAINSTKILLQEITNAGAVTDLTDADFTNTSQCIISFTYTV